MFLRIVVVFAALLQTIAMGYAQPSTSASAKDHPTRTDALTDLLEFLSAWKDPEVIPSGQLSRHLLLVFSGRSDVAAEKRVAIALESLALSETIGSITSLDDSSTEFYGQNKKHWNWKLTRKSLSSMLPRL